MTLNFKWSDLNTWRIPKYCNLFWSMKKDIYIYIYIYIERERERERETNLKQTKNVFLRSAALVLWKLCHLKITERNTNFWWRCIFSMEIWKPLGNMTFALSMRLRIRWLYSIKIGNNSLWRTQSTTLKLYLTVRFKFWKSEKSTPSLLPDIL